MIGSKFFTIDTVLSKCLDNARLHICIEKYVTNFYILTVIYYF